jgi:hypothetical protein
MTSIFKRALGAEFARLHPRLRERFGFASTDRVGCVGTGVMDRVWRGSAGAVPFLRLGAARHILFPEQGVNIPFTIENYAYRDGYGRETLTFVRTFDVAPHRRRRFDATMVYSPERATIVDFLGTHQHFAVALELHADSRGGLWIHSGEQRYAGRPFPRSLSGCARVHEWWDEAEACFRIDVRVVNRFLGPVFGYRGRFTTRYVDTGTAPVPVAVRPLRENATA